MLQSKKAQHFHCISIYIFDYCLSDTQTDKESEALIT